MKKISNLITYSILIFVLCDITWPKINSLLPDTIKFLNELFLGKIVLVGFVFSILFYICWKIPGLNFLLKFLFGVNTKLSGTWKGKMYCEYDNSYRDIYFTIIQKDAFTIGCNMYTENRESYSKNACIHEINGNETIVYQYFPRDPDSIFIIHEEQKKPCEPEGIRRYGCPRPEISKKPSKLRRIIEIIKEK